MTKAAKDYRDYPEAYFGILDKLMEHRGEVTCDMTWREASAQRRNMHRFFAAIRRADTDGDKFIAPYANFIRDVMVLIRPTQGAGDDPAELAVVINPLAIAIQPSTAPKAGPAKVDKKMAIEEAPQFNTSEVQQILNRVKKAQQTK